MFTLLREASANFSLQGDLFISASFQTASLLGIGRDVAPNGPGLIGSSFLGAQPSLCELESKEGGKRSGVLNHLAFFQNEGEGF